MAKKLITKGVDSSVLVKNLNSEMINSFDSNDIIGRRTNDENNTNIGYVVVLKKLNLNATQQLYFKVEGHCRYSSPICVLGEFYYYVGTKKFVDAHINNVSGNLIDKAVVYIEEGVLKIYLHKAQTYDLNIRMYVYDERYHKDLIDYIKDISTEEDIPDFGDNFREMSLKYSAENNTGNAFDIVDLSATVSTLDLNTLPPIANVDTIILRYNGVVQDLDTYIAQVEEPVMPLPMSDGIEVNAEMPATLELTPGIMPMVNLDDYVGTPNNWLKIYVHNDYVNAYKEKYPYIKSYFLPINNLNPYANLQINTNNLYLNSNFYHGIENWYTWNQAKISVENDILTLTQTGASILLNRNYQSGKRGECFTISGEIRSDDVKSLNYNYVIINDNTSNQKLRDIPISDQWQRVVLQFRLEYDTENFSVGFGALIRDTQYSIQYRNLKLERSQIDTGYSISQEEIISEIDTLKNTVLSEIDLFSYGIEWDDEISSSRLTRIGNIGLHRSLPIQSKMRGCILNDDGEVVKYLPETNWSEEDTNGELGQVMVEIPEHYVRYKTKGTKHEVRISEHNLEGFTKVSRMYVSAYEATTDKQDMSNVKLCSVKSQDPRYRGGAKSTSDESDLEYNSPLGLPVTYINRKDFHKYARNRKDGDFQWNIYTYLAHKTLTWLYCIEYADRNIQLDYEGNYYNDDLKHGGLGLGCTNLNQNIWRGYNNDQPIVKCGYTDEFGNQSGVKDLTLSDIPGYNLAKKDNMNGWKGIISIKGEENILMSSLLDGVLIIKESTAINQSVAYTNAVEIPLKNRYKIEGLSGKGISLIFYQSGKVDDIISEDGEIEIEWVNNLNSRYIRVSDIKEDLNIRISLVSSEPGLLDMPDTTVSVMRYRGIENIIGNCFKWINGVNVDLNSYIENIPTNIYTCENPEFFTDNEEYENYHYEGILPKNGWVKEIMFNDNGCIIPLSIEDGASNSTYFTSMNQISENNAQHKLVGIFLYSNCITNTQSGLFAFNVYILNLLSANVGTRLVYHPKES